MSRYNVLPQVVFLAVPCTLFVVGAYRLGLFVGATTSDRNRRRRARGGEGLSGDVLSPSSSGEEEAEAEEVERVLSLWFDGSTTENHRTKWFAQVCVCVVWGVGCLLSLSLSQCVSGVHASGASVVTK